MKPSDERDLAALLREWKETPANDSRLAREVARRVAMDHRPTLWRLPRTWLPFALGCVATGVALGVIAAELRDWMRLRDPAMPARYLQWIQPSTGAAAAGGVVRR